MNLLTTIAFCEKDKHLVIKLLNWIKTLHEKSSHLKIQSPLLLAADAAMSRDEIRPIRDLGESVFLYSQTILVNVPKGAETWPAAANVMFSEVARHVRECYKEPWLWLEPDAVPVRPEWLKALAYEYEKQPRQYMGRISENQTMQTVQGQPVNTLKRQMSGVAIYPQNAYNSLARFCGGNIAFDIQMAEFVCARAQHTDLIQNVWGDFNKPPVFSNEKTAENVVGLDFIKPEAALFHRCKDGSLIDLLSQKCDTATESMPKEAEPTTEPVAIAPKRRGRPAKSLSENLNLAAPQAITSEFCQTR